MLKLPGDAAMFLASHWQKTPLFIPGALDRVRPAVSRNEIGWLATLEDVESRLVVTERGGDRVRYRAETGPFDPEYLAALPGRDWTLLVHDVEKHLPVMRKLLAHVPFIPDWRIDDLMVSFAAPGGGVGPHKDNYDVFLCQGIGAREWHVATDDVASDPLASDELSLTAEFQGQVSTAREGDVLYLPPGVAHWGTAQRACITYSIGMRAPQLSDLGARLPDVEGENPFYRDPDLSPDEASPGYLSGRSVQRAMQLLNTRDERKAAKALGQFVTSTKDWITPERPTGDEADAALKALRGGRRLSLHGMARIAFDDRNVYANGRSLPIPDGAGALVTALCRKRHIVQRTTLPDDWARFLHRLIKTGTFDLPGNL